MFRGQPPTKECKTRAFFEIVLAIFSSEALKILTAILI
jgi:hypothetical protein